MKKQSDYKRILEYFIKVNTGLWFIILGLILIIVPHFAGLFLQTLTLREGQIAIERFNALGAVVVVIGATFLTVGLTFIIVDVLFTRYQEREKDLKQKGIMNVFENRAELQTVFSYKHIVSRFEQIIFIGTKHSDFTECLFKNHDGIRDLIAAKGKGFKIKIYFLNPNSEYKYLFDEDEKLPDKTDLGQAILMHIKNLLRMMNDYPELRNRITIYLYNTIPIGNITILDNHIYIVNRYLFFEESPKTLWFELTRNAAATQRIEAYLSKVEKDKPREINSLSELKPLENTELKELLTVLDGDGKPTNFNRAREIIHRRGYLHRTVHIWIVNSKQEVLLQKRGNAVEVSKLLWGCACTGHITTGKSSLETVVDEVYQELGINILTFAQAGKVLKIGEFRHNFDDEAITFHDNEINDVYLVEVDKTLDEYTRENGIVEEIRFMNYKEFENDYKINPQHYVTSHREEHNLVIRTLKQKYEAH